MKAPVRDRAVGLVSLILYLGVGAVPYLGSGLVVPWGAAVFLWVMWLLGLAACLRLTQVRPFLALVAAPSALAFWVGFVLAGSALFGWTA